MTEADTLSNQSKILVLEELHRALEVGFADASERQRKLLGYLVGEELEGRGDRLKAYSIATQVLGRPADFDAQQDSIVRVEVGRLRRSLEYYYLTAGAGAPVVIAIPKGQYRPVFQRAEMALPAPLAPQAPPAPLAAPLADPLAAPPVASRGPGLWFAAGAAVVLLCAAILGLIWLNRPPAPVETRRPARGPVVAIAPFSLAADKQGQAYIADGLQAELAATLSEFEWLTVVPLTEDVAIRADREPNGSAADFVARVSLRLEGDKVLATALLLDGETGGVRWTKHYDVHLHADEIAAMQRDIASKIAVDVGHPFGIVADIARTRLTAEETSSDEAFLCELQAFHYWKTLRSDDFAVARGCFENARNKDRFDADSLAIMALLTLDPANAHFHGASGGQTRAEGRRLAQKAFQMANFRFLPRVAYYSAALCAGDTDVFRDVARAVVRDYPNHPLALVDVGAKFVLGADAPAEGLPLIERARALSARLLATEVVAPAVDALRREDFSTIDRLRKMAWRTDSIAAIILHLSLAAARGDAEETARAKARLAEVGLSDKAKVLAALDAYCWSPSTRALVARHVETAYAGAAR